MVGVCGVLGFVFVSVQLSPFGHLQGMKARERFGSCLKVEVVTRCRLEPLGQADSAFRLGFEAKLLLEWFFSRSLVLACAA